MFKIVNKNPVVPSYTCYIALGFHKKNFKMYMWSKEDTKVQQKTFRTSKENKKNGKSLIKRQKYRALMNNWIMECEFKNLSFHIIFIIYTKIQSII